MPSRSNVWKPVFSAFMLYVPIGIVGATYPPLALVLTTRVNPVPVLVSVTAASATAALDSSVMVPTIVPLCAPAQMGTNVITIANAYSFDCEIPDMVIASFLGLYHRSGLSEYLEAGPRLRYA